MERMRVLILTILMMCNFVSFGNKLTRGFDALKIYNYFEARWLFKKSLKKHPVPAAYGLSVIYARKDNPFSNLDSAFSQIKLSFISYSSIKAKWKKKYAKYGIDSAAVVNQRDAISRLYFERAMDVNSIFGYQDFIDKNSWSPDVDSATYCRDELAFNYALRSGASVDFSFFLAAYPESGFRKKARKILDKTLFMEQTFSNKFIDYVNFVRLNPDSPYRGVAEDRVYEIATGTGTALAYRNFISEFPTNRNIKQAWKYLYSVWMKEEYSAENILEFKNEYPDYPFQKELIAEYNMANRVFYPIRRRGKWGFCDKAGDMTIEPKFQLVEWFTEGLAVVKYKDKYGHINKLGELIIPANYDDVLPYKKGYALVEIGELWGIIDRNGNFVVEAKYDDLGTFNDGLCYFRENELYGYFDTKGIRRLKPQYSQAFDFEEGIAIVSRNEHFGIIDQFGTTHIPFKYQDLYYHSDGQYVAQLADHWGLINMNGETLVDFKYDYIGKPHNGTSLVELDDKFNYLNSMGNLILKDWVRTYPEYRQMAVFKNGYAKIHYDRGFNLTNIKGKKLLRKDWDDIESYGDLIAVRIDEKWGYVDVRGQEVLPFEYTYAYSFQGNHAIVQLSSFYGVIDKKGNYLMDPFQEDLRLLNDSILIAKSMEEYGLISISGDTLLNYQYFNIEPIDGMVIKLEEEGEVFYYDCQMRRFIGRKD